MALKYLAALALILAPAHAVDLDCAVPAGLCAAATEGSFPLVEDGRPASVNVADDDHPGVILAARNLEKDLRAVAGEARPAGDETLPVIAGSIDRSSLIRRLIEEGKLDVASVEGRWEAFLQTVVEAPLSGVERALVIAGSDQRGTIFGIYDIAERAGVSPWHYWADVPAEVHEDLYVTSGQRTDAPGVKYRGIFLNDENPALYGFANDTFGGFNAAFYEKVFDLILRLKGNFLWPAMWGKAFYDDDPGNAALAARMGIVVGTSHHEPLARAHVEWSRYGEGDWNYLTNDETLRQFWREGMERLGDGEALVTIGMRGDGDEAMTEGTAIELLERIVGDQRDIIAETTGKPPSETPQVWALYKEVQDYYDQGMSVPNDVTLLFADDNWGNIRRLPVEGSEREGGYGVYYHFDYVGGPRNYKWLNTTQVERTWQQMSLAWDRGVDRLWIVNVGDLKPMELPISFFLDQAWAPEAMTHEAMDGYAAAWAGDIFGDAYAEPIGELLETYTKFNARRKPELLDAETYDAASGEWDRVTAEYNALAEKADSLREGLPETLHDAYDQLVWFPIQAMSNLHDLYRAAALNALYAEQNRPLANEMAEKVEEAFAKDSELTRYYHEDIADGKWNHMMSQTRIGYTYWQQPEEQTMPETYRIDVDGEAALAAASRDGRTSRDGEGSTLELARLDSAGQLDTTFDLYTTGGTPMPFEITTNAPWITATPESGIVGDQRIKVAVDWDRVPTGKHDALLHVRTDQSESAVSVVVPLTKRKGQPADVVAFTGAPIALAASAVACRMSPGEASWTDLPNLGRRTDGLRVTPDDGEAFSIDQAPLLVQPFRAFERDEITARLVLAPSLDVDGGEGLRYAIAVGDEKPQIVRIDLEPDTAAWNEAVARNAAYVETKHRLKRGVQDLRIWALSPSLVFQEVQLFAGEEPETYLGPELIEPQDGTACEAE